MSHEDIVTIRCVNDYIWDEIKEAMSDCETYADNIRHGKNARMIIRDIYDRQGTLSASFFNKCSSFRAHMDLHAYVDRYNHMCDEMKNIMCEIFVHINRMFCNETDVEYKSFIWKLFESDMRVLGILTGTGTHVNLSSEDSLGNMLTLRKETLKRAVLMMKSMDRRGLARIMNNDQVWGIVRKFPHMHTLFIKFVSSM